MNPPEWRSRASILLFCAMKAHETIVDLLTNVDVQIQRVDIYTFVDPKMIEQIEKRAVKLKAAERQFAYFTSKLETLIQSDEE